MIIKSIAHCFGRQWTNDIKCIASIKIISWLISPNNNDSCYNAYEELYEIHNIVFKKREWKKLKKIVLYVSSDNFRLFIQTTTSVNILVLFVNKLQSNKIEWVLLINKIKFWIPNTIQLN